MEQKFSITASIHRKDMDKVSEEKLLQLLKRFVKGWEHGEIKVTDVIEYQPKK